MATQKQLRKQMTENGFRFRYGKYVTKKEAEVIDNLSKPINLRHCRLCGNEFLNSEVLDHVKKCWGMTYEKLSDVPSMPPVEAVAHYAHQNTK